MQNPPPSPAPRASNPWKWIGIGCGGALLVGIVVVGGLVYWAQKTLNLSVTPESAEKSARAIMDYEIPGESQGLIAMNIAGVQFAGVTSASKPGEIVLFLGQVSNQTGVNQQEIEESFRQGVNDQQQGFESQSTRTESRQLCGQTVTVAIAEGQQSNGLSTTPALFYQTTVEHNKNLVLVSLMTTGEQAQATADDIFASLACKP